LAQELIRQLGVNETNFDFDPLRESLNLKSDQVNMAEYRLPAHAEVFSCYVRIRELNSKCICNVSIEQAIRRASVYQANHISAICSRAKPNLKQREPDVIATRAR